ncbi:MAG: low molecular weight protein-tyrosine-phosphatase [Steroidobacteraceae bacterium]
MDSAAVKILFVCLGNICRSPTAEGVFRAMAARELPEMALTVDSAGTADYHVGEAPDRRTCEAALRRGYDLSGLRARVVEPRDFEVYDLILAMDRQNLETLKRHAPVQARGRVRLLLEFAPHCGLLEVPDPYYGGAKGFEQVLELIEAASLGLCAALRSGALGP